MAPRPVEIERLYQHVLNLEGVRHPITDPEGLRRAAGYIEAALKTACSDVVRSDVPIVDPGAPYVNIEGVVGDAREVAGDRDELLITAHYDTRRNTPGADDNASAVAIMLEAARVLSGRAGTEAESLVTGGQNSPIVRCIGFTLEEENPARERRILETGRHLGVLDEGFRYRSYAARQAVSGYRRTRDAALKSGSSAADAISAAESDIGSDMTDALRKFLSAFDGNRMTGSLDWIGTDAIVGSSAWVDAARDRETRIAGVINLETVGYTTQREGSQRLPQGISPEILPRHKVDASASVGDFVAIVSDRNSIPLGQRCMEQCASAPIDLPALHFALPHTFEEIGAVLPDALRSDHAPFWRRSIPAVMLTDTADFRNPHYHGAGDTHDTLDYEFMRRVTEVVVATAETFAAKPAL